MTQFTLIGKRGKSTIQLKWDNGTISGPADAVRMVHMLADSAVHQVVGIPGGPYTYDDHLASPYSALALMRQVFSSPPKVDGALPPVKHQSQKLPPKRAGKRLEK